MRDLGLDNSYIYREYFCNFMEIGFYSGRVSGRVLDFFDKIQTHFGFFFFLNPYLTLFLIGPGKTQPIRVGSGWVPMGRAEIAIPTKPSKLLALTRLRQTVSSLAFRIPQLAHCINQYELVLI